MAPRIEIRPDRDTRRLAESWALVPVWCELLADVSTPGRPVPLDRRSTARGSSWSRSNDRSAGVATRSSRAIPRRRSSSTTPGSGSRTPFRELPLAVDG